MSEQYQRFKQNFFKQHPPTNNQSKGTDQTDFKSFKQYDPYSEYKSDDNKKYGGYRNEQLMIQNETHFPFQQIEQNIFEEFENDQFMSYKQENDKGEQKSGKKKKYQPDSGHPQSRNESYQEQQKSYKKQHPGKGIPTRTESQLEYRTVSKYELDPQNFLRTQHSETDKINNQIDRLRLTRQQLMSNTSHQAKFQLKQKNTEQKSFSQYRNDINNQYLVDNNRTNNLLPLSPPKQLPVIYNRHNSLSNSQHKPNPQTTNTTNSRVIIQQAPSNQHKNSLLLSPSPNSIHPVIINHPQTFNQVPQIPQPISSGSRVIIHSEILGQSKELIQSNQNISPTGHNIVHRPVVMHSAAQVHFENRNVQESMIPLKDYERLKSQCLMWQHKFYQANDQLNILQSERGLNSYGNGPQQQTVLLREENTRLMEKIIMLQNLDKNSYEKIKSSYEELMKKYQNSLMKETNLLIDRFRLEIKHNERY